MLFLFSAMDGFCKLFFFFAVICSMVQSLLAKSSSPVEDHENERESLVAFMSGLRLDRNQSLEGWNSSTVHVCEWSGVTCNGTTNHVTELDLSGRLLRGLISSSLADLTFLTVLDLSKNFLGGGIPASLGSLRRLKQLSLSWNFLEGLVPAELGGLRQLVYLDLGSNRLTGDIPGSLFCGGSFSTLQYVDLSNNSLSGQIPLQKGCYLRDLRYLLLWSNQLTGTIPLGLSNSTKLEWLDLESNKLTGELPSEIVRNMPFLQFLYLSYNEFLSHDGNTNLEPFFASLSNSSNLQELEMAGNNLGGQIPPIIGDLSGNLVQVHLDDNLIYGPIPPQISNLVNLTLLNLSTNLLNGTIPQELSRMEKLERVYLSNNSLSGEIPSVLGDIPHLGLLDLSRNKLSGPIPESLANLSQLRKLVLHGNQLSGTIPSSLGKCVNLEILDLSHNNLSGLIPGEVAGLRSLKLYLNLSNNQLHGSLPLELSKMDMVLSIDLSSNNLSGTIPPQLGSCIALEQLNLSRNLLDGSFPDSIGQLPYLQDIDVSYNQLSGQIPETLQTSLTLKHLNLSFNSFSGYVPNQGTFSSVTIDSFLGNSDLCGSIQGMPKCPKKRTNRRFVILPIVLSLFVSPILCAFGYPILRRSRMRKKLSDFGDSEEDEETDEKELKYPRISYRQLIEATGGFNAASLIGSGRFGQVYKGILGENTRIAVKVLDTKMTEISGSFKTECQVLKRIRHRNLIRIITICSKPDFKALVLPLMANGSLETHLYPRHGGGGTGSFLKLDLVQLVSICSDVAEGVAYLHHHSPDRVVHCDLKPSNILLDDDFTAIVADFGIAKLVKESSTISDNDTEANASGHTSVSCNSTDGLLCGSVGYIAPEYGMGKQASTHGDVFSFGVLLLEIVSGVRPTDVLLHQGSNLHEWVKSQYPYKLEAMVEQALTRCAPGGSPAGYKQVWSDVILELIELGLICTQYSPLLRPNMLDVAHEMGRLKQYVSNPSLLIKVGNCN